MIITNPFEIIAPNPDEGDSSKRRAPVAVAFGAHDPLYGSGVGADARTWIGQGVHPLAVITRVEARNTQALRGALQMPTEATLRQLEALRGDTALDAIKTGLLGDVTMTRTVADALRALADDPRVGTWLCDPELVSRSGEQRVERAVIAATREHLVPHAGVVVVNCYEAELLTERQVGDRGSIRDALKALFDVGGGVVVVKGPPDERHAVDYVYDGSGVVEFGRDRVRHAQLMGSGGVFSAAIAGRLALGDGALEAVEAAKELITAAVSAPVRVGGGEHPVHALAPLYKRAGVAINSLERSEDPEEAS
ncbi:MAG: hypothetical protein CMH57_01645 [Myxococcales bacterium]|nr:hypothetical protein [Myxococcales bacterium]